MLKITKILITTLIVLLIIALAKTAIADLPKPDAIGSGYYSGDAHLHTNESWDAYWFHPLTDVNDMVTAAKREGLNWITITDHSEVIFYGNPRDVFTQEDWQSQQEDIAAVTDFPVIPGEEITMGNGNDLETQGHFLGYGLNNLVQTLYDTTDPTLQSAQDSLNNIRIQNAFGYIAHPYRFGAMFSFMDAEAWRLWDLVPANEDIIKGIELLHASHETPTATINAWDKKLQQGKKFFAIGNSDAHQAGRYQIIYPIVGEAFTYIKTNGPLTKSSSLEALKNGRSVVSNGPFIDVKVAGKGPGENIDAQIGDNLQITVEWNSNQELKELEIFDQTVNSSGEPTPIKTLPVSGYTGATVDSYTVIEDGYIRLKAETVDGKVAYSNPIFIQVPGSSQETKIFQQTESFKVSTSVSKPTSGYILGKNIYKNKIVWWEGTSTKWGGSIYLKDLSTGEQSLVVANTARNPDIYGNIVVWEDNRNGNWDIFAKDISTGNEFQVTNNPADQTNPSIFGKTVVWKDERNRSERPADDYEIGAIEINQSDIYMKDLQTGIEAPVSLRFSSQSKPVINDRKVAWVDYRNLYKPNSWRTLTDGDIYYKDLNNNQEIQVTTNPDNQGVIWEPLGYKIYAPAIYSDRILWVDGRNMIDGTNQDIYMKDISSNTEIPLTLSSNDQTSPAIYGNYAAWTDTNWDDPNGNSVDNLTVANLSSGNQKRIKLANNNYSTSSDIYNNILVWDEDSNINQASLFDSQLVNTSSLSVKLGETTVKQINIKPGLLQTEFNFAKKDNVSATLIQSDGIQISAASFGKNITYAKTASSESFKIDNPMSGEWQIKLEPLSVPAEGEEIEVDNLAISETPPTVSLSTPNDKAIVRNTITVNADATDDEEIKDFSLALDGEPIAASADNKNVSCDWDTTQNPDGYHELSAIASDVKQSIGQDSRTIVIDNYQPQAVIETANWIINSLQIDFDATKSVDVAEFNYNWNFGDGVVQNESSALSNHLYINPGIYNVSLTVKDAAGNSNSVTKQLIIDTDAPNTSMSINNNDIYTSSTRVNLSLQATDDISGVYQMRFSNDGENYSDWEEYSQTKLWILTDSFDEKIVFAQFKDRAGNIATVTDSIFLIPINYIQNPSFETDTDSNNIPDNWIPFQFAPGDGRSTDFAKEGTYSLKIVGSSTKYKRVRQRIETTGSAGENLVLSGYNKTIGSSSTGGCIDVLVYLNNTDGTRAMYSLRFSKYAHDWLYRSTTITPSKNYSSIDVYVVYYLQTGTAYFDDLKLSR